MTDVKPDNEHCGFFAVQDVLLLDERGKKNSLIKIALKVLAFSLISVGLFLISLIKQSKIHTHTHTQ